MPDLDLIVFARERLNRCLETHELAELRVGDLVIPVVLHRVALNAAGSRASIEALVKSAGTPRLTGR